MNAQQLTREPASADAAPAPGPTAAECALRRLLLLPVTPTPGRTRADDASTYRLVNLSLALSGLRCVLTYVIFPVLAPALGATSLIGPAVGVPVAVAALFFDVLALRRFWAANHRLRWKITPVYVGLMALVAALLVVDLVRLAG